MACAQIVDIGAELRSGFRVRHTQLHRGFEIAELAAAVETAAAVAIGVHRFFVQQRGDAVGELNFASGAGLAVAQMMKHAGAEDVATHDRLGAGRDVWSGFFDDARQRGQPGCDFLPADDAVAFGVLARHFFGGEDAAAMAAVNIDHLRHDGRLADEQVIGEDDGKRLVAHQTLSAKYRRAQAVGHGLAHEHALHVVGFDAAHHVEHGLFARFFELMLQFVGGVEMILDGALVAAGDKNHFGDARRIGLFDRILNERLVDHGHHLFRSGFGRGQKTRAETGNGEDGFGDGRGHGEYDGGVENEIDTNKGMIDAAAQSSTGNTVLDSTRQENSIRPSRNIALGQNSRPDRALFCRAHLHPATDLRRGAQTAAANIVEPGGAHADAGGVGLARIVGLTL